MSRRWDDDERGRGIASAESFAPAAERLLASVREPDWVRLRLTASQER